MSFKEAISKVEDYCLIQTFLEFVQNYQLQYEKLSKEISYKCHEATWILASTKATGYGRNQSEAYKHALRNLLELLVEEPKYETFFRKTFKDLGVLPRKLTIKEQLKTQVNDTRLQKTHYLKESSILNQIGYCKNNDRELKKNQSFKTENQPQIYYSKIQLNKSSCSNSSFQRAELKGQEVDNSSNKPDELLKAKQRVKKLQEELEKLNDQNKVLRERISSSQINDGCGSTLPSKLDSDQSEKQKKSQSFWQKKQIRTPLVPKLKLDVLPNYHKKSQKSLNQSMLAAYQQKYSVKKIQ